MELNEYVNKPIGAIKGFFSAADQKIEDFTGEALTFCGRQWQNLSTAYHEKICATVGDFVGSKIHENLKNPVTIALKVLPVALAILVFASPLGITNGLIKGLILGTAILLSAQPLTKDAKVTLCQGGILAVALKTSSLVLKAISFGDALLIGLAGVVAAEALYYASRHFQK